MKDPHIFTQSARTKGYEPHLPLAARRINESMIEFVVSHVDDFVELSRKNPVSAKLFLMGMAFKGIPETSDIRFSTSVDILRQLQKRYPRIAIYDPIAQRSDLETLGAVVVSAPEKGFQEADAVLVLTNHPSFTDLDIFALAATMNRPGLLFDPWGAYTEEQLSELEGIAYAGL